MSVENRQRWMEHNADQAVTEFDMACLPLLPPDVKTAIQALATYVFERGYNHGVDHGRTELATSRKPSYSVPKPALEAVIDPSNVA